MRLLANLHYAFGTMFVNPVLASLRTRHPRVRTLVWFQPRDAASLAGAEAARESLRAAGADVVRRPRWGDEYLSDLFWTSEFGEPDFFPPRRLPRVQIFHSSAVHKGWVFTRVQRPYDHFFITGPVSREIFEERVRPIHPGAICHEIGYPKIDPILGGRRDRAGALRRFGLRADTPVVLYAPTHGGTLSQGLWSSADRAGREILARLLADGLQVILRLHPYSFGPGGDGFDYRAAFAEFLRHPDFRWDDTGNSNEALAAADLLVADCGGIVAEAAALDLPVVCLDDREYFRRNLRWDTPPRGDPEDFTRSGFADLAEHPEELAAAVRENLRVPARRAADRAVWRERLFYNLGSASAAAADRLVQIAGGGE